MQPLSVISFHNALCTEDHTIGIFVIQGRQYLFQHFTIVLFVRLYAPALEHFIGMVVMRVAVTVFIVLVVMMMLVAVTVFIVLVMMVMLVAVAVFVVLVVMVMLVAVAVFIVLVMMVVLVAVAVFIVFVMMVMLCFVHHLL